MCDMFEQAMQNNMCKKPQATGPMCPPPMPGQGMNITISIDLGTLMNPCPPMEMPPSTSLTKMPKPVMPEADECEVISFNDKKEKPPSKKPEGEKEDEEC